MIVRWSFDTVDIQQARRRRMQQNEELRKVKLK